MSSPTARTLALLRRAGYEAGVVERRNPKMKFVTHDFLGCIDVIGVCEGYTVGIQATSAANQSARRKKILAEPRALVWLKAGNELYVHGWRKSAKNNRWVCNEIAITVDDFEVDKSA